MAGYDPGKAQVYNEAIAQGLDEEQALAAAGITEAEADSYEIGVDGQITNAGFNIPNRSGSTLTTNQVDDDPEIDTPAAFRTVPISSATTTTSQQTVTGGTETVTRVTPTTYTDTPQSLALQASADGIAAQKEQRAAALRAEGKTGAEILRDPEYRSLSQQQQSAELAVQDAKQVDQIGQVTVTTTPGAAETFSGPTVDEEFLTTNTGDDPTADQSELEEFVADSGPVQIAAPAPLTDEEIADYRAQTAIQVNETGAQFQEAFVSEDAAAAEEAYYRDNPEAVRSVINAPAAQDPTSTTQEVDVSDADLFGADPASTTVSADDPQANQFVFDENGELLPADSAAAERVLADQAAPQLDPYEVDGAGIGLTEEEIQAQDNPILEPDPQLDPYEVDGAGIGLTEEEIQEQDNPTLNSEAITQAARERAYIQQALEIQRAQTSGVDWRVKLSLAAGADYLYKDPGLNQQGILWPLAVTNGVVFPYTPTISTSYTANYNTYDLTHSNYRGYFYQNSYVDEITLTAAFTAQDTSEANYLLAVIHFFRSVTKMFYGQDANRGAPPPLVFLQGLGEFQFNLHPCVVRTFNYNLPSDVDYIRARVASIDGTNLQYRRDRSSVATNPLSGIFGRLTAAGLKQGALRTPPPPPTLGTGSPTYVPTKMEITIGLLPIQTREQVSKQFSVKQFASGDLLKGGFW